jgi:hypothetical protein
MTTTRAWLFMDVDPLSLVAGTIGGGARNVLRTADSGYSGDDQHGIC